MFELENFVKVFTFELQKLLIETFTFELENFIENWIWKWHENSHIRAGKYYENSNSWVGKNIINFLKFECHINLSILDGKCN